MGIVLAVYTYVQYVHDVVLQYCFIIMLLIYRPALIQHCNRVGVVVVIKLHKSNTVNAKESVELNNIHYQRITINGTNRRQEKPKSQKQEKKRKKKKEKKKSLRTTAGVAFVDDTQYPLVFVWDAHHDDIPTAAAHRKQEPTVIIQ